MKMRVGFFILELIIGFLLLQTIVMAAAGYFSYQTRLYRTSLQRMQALDLAHEMIERCWPAQTLPAAQTINGFTCVYEPLKVKAFPTYTYGLYTISYDNETDKKSVSLAVGSMGVTCT